MYFSPLRHTFNLAVIRLERPIVLLSLLPPVVTHFRLESGWGTAEAEVRGRDGIRWGWGRAGWEGRQ